MAALIPTRTSVAVTPGTEEARLARAAGAAGGVSAGIQPPAGRGCADAASSGARAPGTVATTSSVSTSRASRTSTASVRPPRATTHARFRWAPGRIGSYEGVASGDGAAAGTTASSAGKPAHHAQQLVGG